MLFGLSPDSRRTEMIQAVLEGVAFSLADGLAALEAAGLTLETVGFLGGGARSRLWARIIAAATGLTLERYDGGEHGGAFGAARLGRMAAGDPTPPRPPRVIERIAPDITLRAAYLPRLAAYRRLYRALAPEYRLSE